jgi:membrane protease YdiL (CAAX protease family)
VDVLKLFSNSNCINTTKFLKKALWYLFIIYISNFIYFALIQLLNVELINRTTNSSNNDLIISKWDYVLKFLQTVILVPILEEFSFRSYINLKRKNILYSIIFLCLLDVFAFLNKLYILSYLLSFLVLAYIAILIFRKNILKFKYVFNILLILSSLTFAFVHIYGKEYSYENSNLLLFSIIPMLILGIGLGFARLKHGLVMSILIHALFNLVGFLAKFI